MSFPVVRRPRPSYGAPPEVEGLPFELLRTALATRDPEHVAQMIAIYEAQEADREVYGGAPGPSLALPQKMMFQQWKTPPTTDGANRPRHADPYASAAGIDAVRADQIAQAQAYMEGLEAGFDAYPIEHAAFDRRQRLSYAPLDTSEVLVRDVPPYGHPMPPYPGADVAEEYVGEEPEPDSYSQGRDFSLASAQRAREQLFGWVFGDVRGRR